MFSNPPKPSPQNHGSGSWPPQAPRKAHKPSQPPKPSRRMRTISSEDQEELDGVLEMARERMGNPETIILAVVKPEQESSMEDLLYDSRTTKAGSEVITATPENLQDKIDEIVDATYTTLYLIVNSAVKYINYNISSAVKNVYVAPYGSSRSGGPEWLHIGSSSSFCGIKVYQWDSEIRDKSLRRHRHTFEEGCCIDLSDEMDASGCLAGQSGGMPSLPNEYIELLNAQFASLKDEILPSSSAGTETWLKKWGSILATVLGGAAACVGDVTGGTIWYGARGVYIKGPLGLFLSTCFSGRASTGMAVIGRGTAVVSATAVYFFIPWDRALEFVRHSVKKIWDQIRDVFAWIEEKIHEWAGNLASFSRTLVRLSVHKPAVLIA